MRVEPLPDLLRSLMAERRITFQDLAEAAGIGIDTAKSWTRTESRGQALPPKQPTVATLEAVAGALSIAPGEIPQYRLAQWRHQFDERPPEFGGVGLDQAVSTMLLIEGLLADADVQLPAPTRGVGTGRLREAGSGEDPTPPTT